MQFDPTNNPSRRGQATPQPVRSGLRALWTGSDENVEGTFVNGDDGKLEQIWISARSEAGKQRFVFCNQSARGERSFNFLPDDVAMDLASLYESIVKRDRTLSESLPEVLRVMEPALWTGFWTPGMGDDMFTLPVGLTSKREVTLMPSFEAFCKNPTLGRNLFAVAGDRGPVGVYINERDNYALLMFDSSVFRIPGAQVAPASLREVTFANATLLVNGSYNEFYRAFEPFRVIETWQQAGGPSVMLAERRGEQAMIYPFAL